MEQLETVRGYNGNIVLPDSNGNEVSLVDMNASVNKDGVVQFYFRVINRELVDLNIEYVQNEMYTFVDMINNIIILNNALPFPFLTRPSEV